MSVAVLGFSSRYTSPGNCSGSYSDFRFDCAIFTSSILWFIFTDATTFSMFMNWIFGIVWSTSYKLYFSALF